MTDVEPPTKMDVEAPTKMGVEPTAVKPTAVKPTGVMSSSEIWIIKSVVLAMLIVLCILAIVVLIEILANNVKTIKLTTLTGIIFSPPPKPSICSSKCTANKVCIEGECVVLPPIFTFTFSRPIESFDVRMFTASVKSFAVDYSVMGASEKKDAARFIHALTRNVAPFRPTLTSATTLTSNVIQVGLQDFDIPLVLIGSGKMLLTQHKN